MVDKFERYHAAQTWFVKSLEIYSSTRLKALEIIGQKICEVMDIQRFGVWIFSPQHDTVTEEITYSVAGHITQGKVLSRADYPEYFTKIDQERVVWVNDTKNEHELGNLVKAYMKPLNIHSLLDAPIFSDGIRIGVICCDATEHERKWDVHDKSFAATSADFIGRIIEAEKRHDYEKELKHRIDYLEKDLHLKLDDLKEANLSLDIALDAAQAGKWEWDITTGKLNLNKTWFTRLGYKNNELPQELETFKKVLHPDDVEHTFETLNKYLKGLTPHYECRFRMITKTGEIQWCIDRGCVIKKSPDGTPLFASGVNINITPIIQLEQSLVVSEHQLKAMIRSLPNPVAMFDRDFIYLAYSAKWEKEWSQFGEMKIGKKVNPFSLKNKTKWFEIMSRALNGETLSNDEELVEILPESQLWLKWIIQPWQLANGEIGGIIIMAENITDHKLSQMKVSQSSKLAALGEMAGGIAHEINNPLSIIKGYIDLLKRHSSRHSLSAELMLQYVEKMDLTVGRISRIVNGMRRFSRESSMDDKVEYSLNKIIDETLDICLERITNNGTALNVVYFERDPIVFCRPVEISQVFLNLINNSFQAIGNLQHPWIKIVCQELPNDYQIMIIDCGSGIPTQIQKKLFQPFFTTKDIGVGTGLGLSISRGIIEEHGGELKYSDDASHTTFIINLPKLHKVDN
jgi:PAS domain S-box-containing protein